MFAAVVFDLDGVLVDSYSIHYESWRNVAAEYGFLLTEEQFAQTFGSKNIEMITRYWPPALLTEESVAAIGQRKEALYREFASKKQLAMDGSEDLVRHLRKAKLLVGVASSAPPENINLAIRQLECDLTFDAIVTSQDVSRGKPDPGVFLLAAERLHVRAEDCVVIEDAPVGVTAANAAGMASVALLSHGRCRDEFSVQPSLYATSLRELSVEVLRSLCHSAENCERPQSGNRDAQIK